MGAILEKFSGKTGKRTVWLLSGLVLVNAAIWGVTFMIFRDNTTLMTTALLAYSFGLRHAVDADHIATIDNVTRKLMEQGKMPLTVGTFFSLGHSTIVVLASMTIAATVAKFSNQMEWFQKNGNLIGTLTSSLFLLIVAFVNLIVLVSVRSTFRQIKAGKLPREQQLDKLIGNGGFLARFLRPLFNLANKRWHIYLLGFLFGLGFDTATEVGLLGISAASGLQEINLWYIMLFPALFSAGMVLVDTIDNLIMVGAYGWAFSRPIRKLYYNMVITALSVIIALFIGGLEALGLIVNKLNLSGGMWDKINHLNEHFSEMGFWIIGIFIVFWVISLMNYRLQKYDKLRIKI